VQCCARDDTEHKALKFSRKDQSFCGRNMHIGCAMWKIPPAIAAIRTPKKKNTDSDSDSVQELIIRKNVWFLPGGTAKKFEEGKDNDEDDDDDDDDDPICEIYCPLCANESYEYSRSKRENPRNNNEENDNTKIVHSPPKLSPNCRKKRKNIEISSSSESDSDSSNAAIPKSKKKGFCTKKQKGIKYINLRVAKRFDDDIYFGTIVKYIPPGEDGEDDAEEEYWHIKYDDDDAEDLELEELEAGLELYKRYKKKEEKNSTTADHEEEV